MPNQTRIYFVSCFPSLLHGQSTKLSRVVLIQADAYWSATRHHLRVFGLVRKLAKAEQRPRVLVRKLVCAH